MDTISIRTNDHQVFADVPVALAEHWGLVAELLAGCGADMARVQAHRAQIPVSLRSERDDQTTLPLLPLDGPTLGLVLAFTRQDAQATDLWAEHAAWHHDPDRWECRALAPLTDAQLLDLHVAATFLVYPRLQWAVETLIRERCGPHLGPLHKMLAERNLARYPLA